MLHFLAKIGLFPLLAILIYFVLDQIEYWVRKPASVLNRFVIAILGSAIFCMFWYKLV